MGCCGSSKVEGADMEIVFRSDLAIQEKVPTLDPEGFADISLTSHRDTEARKSDAHPMFMVNKSLEKQRNLSIDAHDDLPQPLQDLITPRFGGKVHSRSSSWTLDLQTLTHSIPNAKLALE
jgi:hypothetical protein